MGIEVERVAKVYNSEAGSAAKVVDGRVTREAQQDLYDLLLGPGWWISNLDHSSEDGLEKGTRTAGFDG